MELRLPDTDALSLQRLLADLHRSPAVFMSRNGDIKPPVPWLFTMQSRMMHVPRS
jgi:hypothetical protein